jgi:hypothetical protein
MNTPIFISRLLHRLHTRSERGDVPGWVLITIMTAGIATVSLEGLCS